jgi:DNA-binding NtrC family response regulator
MTETRLDELIIGTSPAMQELRDAIRRAANLAGPVLIQGPTGAGKELVANGLHSESRRPGKLVACNAAAIPEGLFESEIMGHVRGAFTGATRDRQGLIRRANHGTLFLDEIGDLDMSAQAKLLRVIDTREVWSVGADVGERIDFHLIAATNVDLAAAERQGRFRRDLLFRLRGIPILVPPLRDHVEDIGQLSTHFAQNAAKAINAIPIQLTTAAVERLERHDWPGNVRELKQTIECASFLADGLTITDVHIEKALKGNDHYLGDTSPVMDLIHRQELLALLTEYAGDVSAVAQVLGITRSTIYRRMHRLGLAVPRRGPRLRPISERGHSDGVTVGRR